MKTLARKMETYLKSLADPFDNTISQPKLLDGRIERTAGLRLRSTGDITCRTTGYTYIALFNGINNVMAYQAEGSDDDPVNQFNKSPAQFTGCLETSGNRAMINKYRAFGAALKLALQNAPDTSDGMFEAVRVPSLPGFSWGGTGAVAYEGNIVLTNAQFVTAFTNVADNPTYMQGRLRDIGRYMFRCNFRQGEIDYVNTAAPGNTDWHMRMDVVLIRIKGRQVTGQPSVLMYQTVSLKELEYNEGTIASRLQTYNNTVNDHDELLLRVNFKQPAILIN